MQRNRLLLMAAAVLTLAVPLQADVTRQDFVAYEKREVVLKDTLYSITYAAPLALSNRTQVKTLGVTVVSTERGVYYGGKFINLGEFADRDPEQLASKVSSRGGRPGFLASLTSGATNQMADGVREARVLRFEEGTRMQVKRINVDNKNNRVIVELYDEFTNRGDASTALVVEWAGDITRAQVEEQMAKFLEFR